MRIQPWCYSALLGVVGGIFSASVSWLMFFKSPEQTNTVTEQTSHGALICAKRFETFANGKKTNLVSYHLGRLQPNDDQEEIEKNVRYFFSTLDKIQEPIFVIVNIDGINNPLAHAAREEKSHRTCFTIWDKTTSDMHTHALTAQAVVGMPVKFFFALNNGVRGPLADTATWPKEFEKLFTREVKLAGSVISCEIEPHVQTHFFVLPASTLPFFALHVLQNERGLGWAEYVLKVEIGLSKKLLATGFDIASMYHSRHLHQPIFSSCTKNTNPSIWCDINFSDAIFLKWGGQIMRANLICKNLKTQMHSFDLHNMTRKSIVQKVSQELPKVKKVIEHTQDSQELALDSLLTCVLVRTVKKHGPFLPALLFSILVDNTNVHVYVADTDMGFETELHEIAATVNIKLNKTAVFVSPINRQSVLKRCPKLTANDYGYVVTDLMIEDVLLRPYDHILITNGDNLYSRHFFPVTQRALMNGADMVATHFISHYTIPSSHIVHTDAGPWRHGQDMEFITRFEVGCVDLGAVLLKAELFKNHGFRFIIDIDDCNTKGVGWRQSLEVTGLDGYLFQRIAETPGIKTQVIPRALFMHQ